MRDFICIIGRILFNNFLQSNLIKRGKHKVSNSLGNMSNSTHTPSQLKRLWMAVMLGTLAAFGPLSIDMYLPALPDIAKDLHTNPSLVQLSLTFFCLV